MHYNFVVIDSYLCIADEIGLTGELFFTWSVAPQHFLYRAMWGRHVTWRVSSFSSTADSGIVFSAKPELFLPPESLFRKCKLTCVIRTCVSQSANRSSHK